MGRNFLDNLLEKALQVPEVAKTLAYLKARERTPEIKVGYLGEGTAGEFEHNFEGKGGKVTLSSGYENYEGKPSPAALATLVHELTHAQQQQFGNQYVEEKRRLPGTYGPNSTQFTDAYQKLVTNLDKPYEQRGEAFNLAKKLDPAWAAKEQDYRASFAELPAFAVGNMINPREVNRPGPPHLDATLATEQAILQELAMRGKLSAGR